MRHDLIRKLEAMADPKLNDNPHEREVARRKLEQLTATSARRENTQFGVQRYAEQHGVSARWLRRKLRGMGRTAPYTLRDVEQVMKDHGLG